MKVTLLSFFILIGVVANAESISDEKVKQLEARIQALESKLGSTQPANGIKVQDMAGKKIKNTVGDRSISSHSSQQPSLSAEQQKEIMEAIEQYKKRQAESQKLLDELMNVP